MGQVDRSHPRPSGLPRAARRVLPGAAAALALIAACGDGTADKNGGLGDPPADPSPQEPVRPLPPGKPEKPDSGSARDDRPPRIRMAQCPPNTGNCSAAVGTVIYIESVDADGDGDLHVVATATRGQAVTGGGLVIFDVNKDLRPERDPAAGDVVTGAGPVYSGSYGQRQIEVDEFRVARRR